MTIIGLDIAYAKPIWVSVWRDGQEAETLNIAPCKHDWLTVKAVLSYLKTFAPYTAVCEHTNVRVNRNTTMRMTKLAGMLEFAVHSQHRRNNFVSVHPMSWQSKMLKDARKKGETTKQASIAIAQKAMKRTMKNSDEADAINIARWYLDQGRG